MDALQFCYKNGLSKNIKVLSHSPSILLNKNIKSKNLYKKWTKEKLIDYQKSILPFTKLIFKKVGVFQSSVFSKPRFPSKLISKMLVPRAASPLSGMFAGMGAAHPNGSRHKLDFEMHEN